LKQKSILTSAALVAVATVLVRLFGFLRELVLAATYGAGTVSDAFVVAFTVPDIVLALVASSAATAFIPTYTHMESGENGNLKFTSNVLTILALIGLIFSGVFSFVPQALTFLFASNLDEETFALTTSLLRIMVWAATPVLITRIFQSYLQIQKAFFLAAVMTIPVNVAAIIAIALSKPAGMTAILGYGVLAGSILKLLYMLLAANRKGYTYRPALNLRMPELRVFFIMTLPIIFTTLLSELTQIIDRNFASSLVSGSISSLNYAHRTVNLFTTLIGMSVATVLFPRMSELSAQGKTDEIRKHISSCLIKLVPVLLPAMIGVILLADPIVRIMFERGDFTSAATKRTAECLIMYAGKIIAVSISDILKRAMFSMHDTKTPAIITAVTLAFGILLKIILIRPLAHIGLALSTSITAILATLLMLSALRKRLGSLKLKTGNWEWVKTLAATIVMGTVVGLGVRLLPVMSGGTMQTVILTMGLVLVGVGIYTLSHAIMKTMFFRDMTGVVKSLLSRKS